MWERSQGPPAAVWISSGNAWDTEEWSAAGTGLPVAPETVASSEHTSCREKVDLVGFICMFNHIVEHAESYHTWEYIQAL